MTELEFARCLSVLERTPEILDGVIRSGAPEDLTWQPSPERWSITFVLAHLADVEVRGFRSRFDAMLNQSDPFLPSYDPGELFQSGKAFDARAELACFRDARARTLETLRGLPAGFAGRTGRHQDFGSISIGQLLKEFAFHDLGHTRQIMELYRARAFYPQIGPFQSIYRINP